MTRAALEQQMGVDIRACVEREKKSKFLGGFFVPRKKLEPGCEQQVRAQYAADLAALDVEETDSKAALDDALDRQLSGDNTRLYAIIGAVLVFMLIIVIIIA